MYKRFGHYQTDDTLWGHLLSCLASSQSALGFRVWFHPMHGEHQPHLAGIFKSKALTKGFDALVSSLTNFHTWAASFIRVNEASHREAYWCAMLSSCKERTKKKVYHPEDKVCLSSWDTISCLLALMISLSRARQRERSFIFQSGVNVPLYPLLVFMIGKCMIV